MTQTTAGELDRRVTLQRPVVTRDPQYGSELTSWSTVATVWARVRDRMAAEISEPDVPQRDLRRQITVRIRWRSDLLTTWRLQIGAGPSARILQINGAIEAGRREWLDLDCVESTGGA